MCGTLVALSDSTAGAAAGTLPPVRHVWVLELENIPESSLFGAPGNDPYVAQTLPSEGAFLPYYFGIGHNSLDNYIAQVSGQAPNPETQQDCGQYGPMAATTTDPHGQVVGQGCEYPASALTLGDQLSAAGLSWKGYMQDMGNNLAGDGAVACAHPTAHSTTQGFPNPQLDSGTSSNFVIKHNPFGYFDSVIDHDASCRQHVVPLDPDLRRDLGSVATTPNFSLVVPTVTWDGHDNSNGTVPDAFLRKYVAMITSSPAFRQDGMLVVMVDESTGVDASACCNEIPGPNSPEPGEGAVAGTGGGDGGGQVGAVVLSPFVRPGTVVVPSNPPQALPDNAGPACAPATCVGPGFYNHYSLLRTVEDLFGLAAIPGVPSSDGAGHLGFAGTYADYPGPGEFGCEVFTAYSGCGPGASPAARPTPAPRSPHGPRAMSTVSAPQWAAPAFGATDLRAIACPTTQVCVAVGAAGTVLASADAGQSWASVPTGTATRLDAVACPSEVICFAVGDAGALVTLTSGSSGWAASLRGLATAGNLNGISCLDPSRCVAVGDNTILSTSNAGATWVAPRSLALPALAPGSTPDLLGVSCATGTEGAVACYAVGSLFNSNPQTSASGSTGTAPSIQNVFRSANPFAGANATWTGQQAMDAVNAAVNGAKNSTRLRGISCSDATHCVAVGESAALSTTTDGSTWNDQSATVPTRSATELFNAVTCPATATGVECVAVGTRPSLGTSLTLPQYSATQASVMAAALGTPGIAASSPCSGGPASTCNTAILEQPGSYDNLNAVTCPAVNECIAVGDGGAITHTAAAFPAASDPAWTAPLRNSAVTWSPVGGNSDASLYGISCASPADCASVGGGNPQLATPDAVYSAIGPSPWTTRSVPAPPVLASQAHQTSPAAPPPTDAGARLTSVSCPVAGHCVAVGTTGWIATLAAGTWTSQLVDPTGQTTVPTGQTQGVVPTEDLQAVSCAPAGSLAGDTCVAVGDRGAVLTSTNGGANWTVTSNSASPYTAAVLDGVACPDSGVCVAVGAAGTVLVLTNTAGHWSATPVPSSTAQLLSSVSCASPTTCVAAGSNGTVLTLSRGLAGWTVTTRDSGVSDELYGVSCASTTVCAAAGANGTVISTVDGGTTWTALGTGTDVTFRSISCPAVRTCYAAGDSGALLSTTTPITGALAASLSLGSAEVSTDGGSTTATVTVTSNGTPDSHATVTLSRTGSGSIGAVTNNGDGTYTATLTASPRVGAETITAQAVDSSLSATATTSLTDTVGLPAVIALRVDPGSIQADGVTTAAATATVTDAHQNAVPGETVAFASDGDVSFSPSSATTDANGVASTTVKASKTVGTQAISASDAAHSLVAHQSLTLLATSITPANVIASPGDEQAIVSWTAATPASGDTLTDYVVTPSPAGGGPKTVAAGTTTTNVTGLTNGTAYTFTVTARFGSGKAATSPPSSPVTPYGEPTAPGFVTAVAGDASAVVSWVKSDGNGSPIQGYTVAASPGGAQVAVSADKTTARVTGLVNGRSYRFTVTAHNAAEAVTSRATTAVVPKFSVAFVVAKAQKAIIGGQSGVVHGTLTHDGRALARARVTVAVRPAGATAYSSLATVTTTSTGTWSLSVKPTRNSTYRLTFLGDAADRPATATTSMLVHAIVHLVSPRNGTKMRSGKVTVTATTQYAVAGTRAWLEYLRPNGEWAALDTSSVGRHGALSFGTTLNRGTRWLRILLANTAINAAGSTKPFVLYLT